MVEAWPRALVASTAWLVAGGLSYASMPLFDSALPAILFLTLAACASTLSPASDMWPRAVVATVAWLVAGGLSAASLPLYRTGVPALAFVVLAASVSLRMFPRASPKADPKADPH